MKSVFFILASFLVGSFAFAGGGGFASSTCFYQQKEVLVSCRSQHLNLDLVSVQLDRYAEAGNKCPHGGQIVHLLRAVLNVQSLHLPSSAITNPSATAQVNQANEPVSPFSLGGLVIQNIKGLIKPSSLVQVSAKVAVGWGSDYESINGKIFNETLRCR